MKNLTAVVLILAGISLAKAGPSAVELVQDIFKDCIRNFKISNCVEPKASSWANQALQNNVIEITEDLVLVKKFGRKLDEEERGLQEDILDKFENFLQSYDVVAKLPAALRPDGPYAQYVPRNLYPTEITVPLATGRSSKIVKKVIFPFLLGLKFKTAVLVPLALALIALKTWKALTLSLLSLVLTGAISIFSKFVGSKVPTYEVIHYPHHHHIDHVDYIPAPIPAPAIHYGHPVYAGRSLDAQEMAYKNQL